MLKQGTVSQVRKRELPRENTLLVLTMRRYPRGLKKELTDEYRAMLSPDIHLFSDWRAASSMSDDDTTFKLVKYESRFRLSQEAFALLECYSKRQEDVYLICQCELGRHCHRELLLLIARELFDAKTDAITHEYPEFLRRLRNGEVLVKS